jgi:hypothetical protein
MPREMTRSVLSVSRDSGEGADVSGLWHAVRRTGMARKRNVDFISMWTLIRLDPSLNPIFESPHMPNYP